MPFNFLCLCPLSFATKLRFEYIESGVSNRENSKVEKQEKLFIKTMFSWKG